MLGVGDVRARDRQGQGAHIHELCHRHEPVAAQPHDEKGAHPAHGVCGLDRHHRHCAHPLALARLPVLHRHRAGADALLLPADDRGKPRGYVRDAHGHDGRKGRQQADARSRQGLRQHRHVQYAQLHGQQRDRSVEQSAGIQGIPRRPRQQDPRLHQRHPVHV